MAVKLRLTRMGRKKRPFYRIVAIDSRAPRDGRYLENLGYYDPLQEPSEVRVNEERVLYWLGVGAVPSDTVRSILRREGILFKWDLIRRGLSEEEMAEKMKMWEVIQLERQRRLEQKLAEKKEAKVEAKPEEEAVEEEVEEVKEAAAPAEEAKPAAEEVAAAVEAPAEKPQEEAAEAVVPEKKELEASEAKEAEPEKKPESEAAAEASESEEKK